MPKSVVAQITPEAREEACKPDVEHRLNTIEGTLSLLLILNRAISQSQDLALTQAQEAPGWSMLSDLTGEALADVWAVQDALPSEAIFTKAPRRAGA